MILEMRNLQKDNSGQIESGKYKKNKNEKYDKGQLRKG